MKFWVFFQSRGLSEPSQQLSICVEMWVKRERWSETFIDFHPIFSWFSQESLSIVKSYLHNFMAEIFKGKHHWNSRKFFIDKTSDYKALTFVYAIFVNCVFFVKTFKKFDIYLILLKLLLLINIKKPSEMFNFNLIQNCDVWKILSEVFVIFFLCQKSKFEIFFSVLKGEIGIIVNFSTLMCEN